MRKKERNKLIELYASETNLM